ncbi:MAG: AIR synthase-related protein [Roseburia sp.]|nr:AIR synthase-related protein [Roseburia sp.]
MNCGRLTESVYERSVVKVMRTASEKSRELYNSAAPEADCAVFPCSGAGGGLLVSGQASACGYEEEVALFAFTAAANNAVAAVSGAVSDAYANLTLTVPERLREIKVRRMLERAAREAEAVHIPILSVNVQALPCVEEPVASCVVSARADSGGFRGAGVDEDIVMTKWIGLEGTALLARRHYDALCGRYPADLVETACGFEWLLSIIPEAATAKVSDVSAVQAVREGGIFGGLWALAAGSGVGLVADLKRIPVRQETIEVCEFFDINPYELLAGGSLLMTTRDGGGLVEALAAQGIAAAVIGRTAAGNDRVVRCEEETRFLEPAKGDELFKIK